MIDAATATANWLAGMSGATAKYTAGIQAVSTAPGVAAARQADVWVQNTTAAKAKFQKNVAAVDLGSWQQAAVQKGAPRLASGAVASQSKMANALQQILPQIASIKQSLPPRGNLEQNIARMNAYVRAASNITVNK